MEKLPNLYIFAVLQQSNYVRDEDRKKNVELCQLRRSTDRTHTDTSGTGSLIVIVMPVFIVYLYNASRHNFVCRDTGDYRLYRKTRNVNLG